MKELLKEIEDDLENAPFATPAFGAIPERDGASSLTVSTKKWRYLAVEFDIEDQGFPPGSKGYDGTATSLVLIGTIVRLTRELAEKAFKKARKEDE